MIDTSKFKELPTKHKKLTDAQWDTIKGFFTWERKRKLCLRSVLDTIFYVLRTGIQWRNINKKYGTWDAIYYYFDKWKQDGTFERVNLALNEFERLRKSRKGKPSLLCVDSQSVKLAPLIFEDRGIDGGKLVNGRKRQIFVDTEGRLYGAIVHAANIADAHGAAPLLDQMANFQMRLEKFLGDSSYNGIFAELVKSRGYTFEKATRLDEGKNNKNRDNKFVPEPKRWVVERFFAWTNFFRRIVKDYEHTVTSAATWLILANIRILLQRIK